MEGGKREECGGRRDEGGGRREDVAKCRRQLDDGRFGGNARRPVVGGRTYECGWTIDEGSRQKL